MKEKEYMRLESDSIGTMEVPEDAYYGVQALRAKENFPITGTKLHPVFIKNLAKIKRAAAITNRKAGRLKPEIANAIEAFVIICQIICIIFTGIIKTVGDDLLWKSVGQFLMVCNFSIDNGCSVCQCIAGKFTERTTDVVDILEKVQMFCFYI